MSSDPSADVRAMYESYPYPERMPGGASDPYLDLMRAYTAEPRAGRCSFLDAGCGTGVNVLGGATLYPHFDVFGCDINRVALSQVQSELAENELHNVELRAVSLLDLPEDFGPSEFDTIFCTGVLHHMAAPEEALRRLAARLAPQGVMRLMVYSQRGRADLYRFAGAVRSLWPARDFDLRQRLERAQSLMAELERRTVGSAPPLRGTWADAAKVGAAEFADRYLHPHDVPYTPYGLRDLLEGAGLRFLDWFEPRDWDLERLLPELAASPDCPQGFWERVDLVDMLFERTKFDLYVVGPRFVSRIVEVGPDTLLSTNPQLFFEQVTVRGAPLAQAARLRIGEIEPLTRSQGRLVQSLGRRFATLRELCHEWEETLGAALVSEAQGLVERGFLFAPHPVDLT